MCKSPGGKMPSRSLRVEHQGTSHFRKSEPFANIWSISLRRLGGSDVQTRGTAPMGLRGAHCGVLFPFCCRRVKYHGSQGSAPQMRENQRENSDKIKHENLKFVARGSRAGPTEVPSNTFRIKLSALSIVKLWALIPGASKKAFH